jgi:hypothetical protein
VRSGVVAPAGPVTGHDHAGADRADILKAVDAHPRPPASPPQHPVGDGRVGLGRPAAPHQHGTGHRNRRSRGERRTVRQDTRRSFSVTPRPRAEETDLLMSRLCGPGAPGRRVFGSFGTHGWCRVKVRNTPVRQEDLFNPNGRWCKLGDWSQRAAVRARRERDAVTRDIPQVNLQDLPPVTGRANQRSAAEFPVQRPPAARRLHHALTRRALRR